MAEFQMIVRFEIVVFKHSYQKLELSYSSVSLYTVSRGACTQMKHTSAHLHISLLPQTLHWFLFYLL